MQAFTISTTNFQTFAELAFRFTLSPAIAAEGIGFALGMGLAGGALPAVRAARMNIVPSYTSRMSMSLGSCGRM